MNKSPSERNTTFQLKRALKAEDECRALQAMIKVVPKPPQAERVPMTDAELEDGFNSPSVDVALTDTVESVFTEGARFAERLHGIGAKP